MSKVQKSLMTVFAGAMLFHPSTLPDVHAAPVQQSVTLKGGWNAVFLQVEPSDPDPVDVFTGVPDLVSVWAWNPGTSPVEYIDNPDDLLPGASPYLAWFPGQPEISDLHAIFGERAYLIHRTEGAPDHPWTVDGEPSIPDIDWVPDSFNLVGFHVTGDPGPGFQDFFSSSPAHAGRQIFVLDNGSGTWVEVTTPDVKMVEGEAFWVYCQGGSEFTGPLAVRTPLHDGLHYGTMLLKHEVLLHNRSMGQKDVTVTVSSPGPRLHYFVFDPAGPAADWIDMTATPPAPFAIPAGESEELLLGVLRAGVPPGDVRTANLQVTDGEMEILIPVSMTGVDYAGLWVGNAKVGRVSQPGAPPEEFPDEPRPTGSEFPLRLIVHLDGGGQSRLLGEVVQLWNESTTDYVLVGNEARIGEFIPGALRDGQPVGRRISTAAFGFPGSLDMAGTFGLNQTLTVTVLLPWDDPTNPFRHLYHPDHRLVEQSYNIERVVSLEFASHDGDGNLVTGAPLLSWGSVDVGGIYRETISLTREDPADVPYTIPVEGTFLLHKVSGIDQLEL